MFAHRALPGILQSNNVFDFHKPSVELKPSALKGAKAITVPILLPVLPQHRVGIGLGYLYFAALFFPL
jgi:hypothetical protein